MVRRNICVHLCDLWETKIIIRGGRNDLSVGKDITDPLYLPLKRGGPVCPLLESPLECLVDVYKTLSIKFSVSKQTASPPLGETGEGFHNVELCIFEITDPLYLPLKRGGLVCPLLESPCV